MIDKLRNWVFDKYWHAPEFSLSEKVYLKLMWLLNKFPRGNAMLWGFVTGLLVASCLFSFYLVLWY